MRMFAMFRSHDESGVSGVGCVLEGAVFSAGECVVRWRGNHGSVNVFKNFDDFLDIHVKSHPTNGTRIEWIDGSIEEY